MTNPYLEFVKNIEAGVQNAKSISPAGIETPVQPAERKALLFSPHPDDECITGLLPLRLMREAGVKIINVPVTFGSDEKRRPGRAAELKAACGFLGWEIYPRSNFMNLDVAGIMEILQREAPEIIFFPHERDWNSRHIKTHFLLAEALAALPPEFSCFTIETEFWGAMDNPDLMIEGDAVCVADLVAALSLHTEEVARNPYHLLLPAWMQDNVRRGGELVGGQGGTPPEFSFATLYRLRRWQNGKFCSVPDAGKFVSMQTSLKELFAWK
ncbi:MAG: PIG-L family deacetylase [Kiritimatiellales bacterium]